MRRTFLRLAAAAALLAVGAAPLLLASATRAATAEVRLSGFAFTPASLTIAVGDTVTWTNDDPVVHTVTSTTGAFDSGDLDQGATYSMTFAAAGDYPYLCTPHPSMTGTIHVVAAAATPAPNGGGSIPNVAMDSSRGSPLVLVGLGLIASGLLLLVGRGLRRAHRHHPG
jgi:plastocyanin